MRSAILVNGKPCFMRDFAKQDFSLWEMTRKQFKRLWAHLEDGAEALKRWQEDETAFEIVRHKNLRRKLGVI